MVLLSLMYKKGFKIEKILRREYYLKLKILLFELNLYISFDM